MKKLICTFLVLVSAQSAFAVKGDKQTTLANQSDFVIVSDVEQPGLGIFLSYAGKAMDHCGIRLRMHSLGADVSALNQFVMIESDGKDVGVIENGELLAHVEDENATLFGQFFTIRSVGGENLKDAIEKIGNFHKTEVIVEILHCQK
jgi:hypothetical protein